MNKVVIGYIILTARAGPDTLSGEVRKFLLNGWEPIGGVSFDGNRYLQAMVKHEEKEDFSDER